MFSGRGVDVVWGKWVLAENSPSVRWENGCCRGCLGVRFRPFGVDWDRLWSAFLGNVRLRGWPLGRLGGLPGVGDG